MSELELSYSGYVLAPYLHNHDSIDLKDSWMNSENIEKLFFVTGTFSNESKPYFSDSVNHYLLAKFKDSSIVSKDLLDHNQDKTSFIFNIKMIFLKEKLMVKQTLFLFIISSMGKKMTFMKLQICC